MAKKKITEVVEELLSGYLEEQGMELYNVEFVKESKDWFLRVFIDKLPGEAEEQYISTDDCEQVSRYLSEKLDEVDPIEQNYYLEVSSPGLDRTLLREKDFIRFAGHPVEVSLYKGIDGKKHYTGELVGWQDGNLVLIGEKGVTLSFPEEAVAKTKLLVIF